MTEEMKDAVIDKHIDDSEDKTYRGGRIFLFDDEQRSKYDEKRDVQPDIERIELSARDDFRHNLKLLFSFGLLFTDIQAIIAHNFRLSRGYRQFFIKIICKARTFLQYKQQSYPDDILCRYKRNIICKNRNITKDKLFEEKFTSLTSEQ